MNNSDKEFLAQDHGKTAPWFDLVNSEEWDTYGHRTEHLDNPAWIPFFFRRWRFAKAAREFVPIAKLQKLMGQKRKETTF